MTDWKPTACVLCENNCGIEVKISGDDRNIEKVRGDPLHPASKGYLCQKASRINYYQNSRDRLHHPLKKTASGDFEQISWQQAIAEIANKLSHIKQEYGGEGIFYYGGGGQGNHLPGDYASATLTALGAKFRTNSLAQEKTGEGWVSAKMFGAYVQRGDFENCEVGVFLGKNPWHSHGLQRARQTLREISKDPERALVVFDPRISETAELANYHIALKPGTDAWGLAALISIFVEEDLVNWKWLDAHTINAKETLVHFEQFSIPKLCEICNITPEALRRLARRLAKAKSIAWHEDLGVQMNRHSTLVSYLHRILWLITGSFGRQGTQYISNCIKPMLSGNPSTANRSPVLNAPIISGMVPCNIVAEEILSDHPHRYRAMIIESANPAHSTADTKKFTKALKRLECTIVIDIAMTETARQADYILPTTTQYEKAEATFFNFEFPENYFHLRHPILASPQDSEVLDEGEIHARIVEQLGELPDEIHQMNKKLKTMGLKQFPKVFNEAAEKNSKINLYAPVVLYRTLGQMLPKGLANSATLWKTAKKVANRSVDSLERAGIKTDSEDLGEHLFNKFISSPHGLVFSSETTNSSWDKLGPASKKINALIPELLDALSALKETPVINTPPDYNFILSAGERRAYTANCVIRDKEWRKKDKNGLLKINENDAKKFNLENGSTVKIETDSGEALISIEISDKIQPGHVSLPNGLGMDNKDLNGQTMRLGIALNELTSSSHRDFFAGTPTHKYIPAKITPIKHS